MYQARFHARSAAARLLAFTFAATSSVAAAGDEPAEPPYARQLPEVRSGPPAFAFNGKDLAGFYTYLHDHRHEDPDGVFRVRDGVLVVSGREFGGISTRDEYANYHLVVEWRWGGKTWPPREGNARDSGILLHAVGPDDASGGHWMESVECQIIEGGTGDLLMVGGRSKPRLTCEVRTGPDGQPYFDKGSKPVTRDSGRFNWWGRDPEWKDVLGFRGARDVEKPLGEWNRLEVVCDGSTITNILNGRVVNVGTNSSHTRGKITFQSEGAEIHFRKIEIRPLLR
ncbi:hypothetical protein OJF2_14550 [Aquisphaera giovannonii]|uniref:3-keto-alpha-glucoside-1,2-lyase/3-keto-2-hydroxy-glucal hydratase domain-containing protein n=1 Tax=Aquisphaera giovannonii TaxID=406548 RepID=A0A5B9VXA1_9BACT|nr:DUF1080 domain-containing protein [Aquisphaera giovannonii]QEH32963.1 hypothetical protein OJF2_14550 [Aquisphaera giovannonii]